MVAPLCEAAAASGASRANGETHTHTQSREQAADAPDSTGHNATHMRQQSVQSGLNGGRRVVSGARARAGQMGAPPPPDARHTAFIEQIVLVRRLRTVSPLALALCANISLRAALIH